MKQTICLFLFAIALASCSSSNDNQQDDFFNLETGNLRVYKRFTSPDGVNFTETSRIDSVFTTGDTIVSGINYEKFVHKVYNSGIFSQASSFTEALREDENGHLVNPSGFVLHPGFDMEYIATRQIFVGDTQVGNMFYQQTEPLNVSVGDQAYFVYQYVGNYSPFNPTDPTQYIFDQYQQGTGLVNQHCSAIYGTSCYQDRLIYYEVD